MNQSRIDAYVQFEKNCMALKHHHCLCCRRTSLFLKINRKQICSDCAPTKDVTYYEKRKLLPIWYNGKTPHYHVPSELSDLTLAEKMLIQLASPFIPLRHIKNGVFGLSGHVCCFEQDVEGFVNTLPRSPTDTALLQVLRETSTEIGGTLTQAKAFTVRKSVVGNALAWLKEFNREYRHIKIDMSALDWLQGKDEGILDILTLKPSVNAEGQGEMGCDVGLDLGPSPSLTNREVEQGDSIKAFGYTDHSPVSHLSPSDTLIHNEILQEVDTSSQKKCIQVQWPATGPVPINEYSRTRIFVRAFPWLFPGGLGDPTDDPGELRKWGQRLLYYEDGRFARDKFFTFYALNYITRHRNAKSGSWFMKEFNKGGPQNLDDLKRLIRGGDTKFINRLMYYNKSIKGSNQYWQQKRSQVYSWINHHVEVGNGPPMFFITLSCGEYYWPDVIRLLKERMTMGNDDRVDQCYHGSPRLTEILNDYTIVIQEYFQKRFEVWMETVGKPLFGISHYWGRFEFAPGRGQIHIHFIAIRKDQGILRLCHEDLKKPDGKTKRDERLASWAAEQLGLTATVAMGFDERNVTSKDSPCSVRLSDVVSGTSDPVMSARSVLDDQETLMKFCQVHECNGFCLRQRGKKR